MPIQAEDFLYVVRMRMRAARAEVVSIVRRDDAIVLQLKDEVGGAREVLQKLLGRGMRVGNTQIRMTVPQTQDGWQKPLGDALEKLAAFRERVASLPADGVGL